MRSADHRRFHNPSDTDFFNQLGISVDDPEPQEVREDEDSIRQGLWRAVRWCSLFWLVVGVIIYATCFHTTPR
jgi:hypothetical protein